MLSRDPTSTGRLIYVEGSKEGEGDTARQVLCVCDRFSSLFRRILALGLSEISGTPSLARLVSLCSNEIGYLWKRLINIAQTEENHSFWSGFLLPAPGERSCWCSGGHSCSRCFWESSTMRERNALKLWHEFWNKQRALGFLYHPWSQGTVMSSHCHPHKIEEFKTVFFF